VNNPMAWLADRIADTVAQEGARVRAELAAGLAQTVNGLRVTAGRPQPLLPNALNSTARGRLVGWSLRETAGSPATVTVYNGRDTGADVLAVIPLAANAGASVLPGSPGVSFGDGLFVAVTGAVVGALYFGAVD
jgi:hypothetical protein